MRRTVVKKSLGVLVGGAALFLALGAGCNDEGNNDNDDRPGVENTQDEQDGEEDDGN